MRAGGKHEAECRARGKSCRRIEKPQPMKLPNTIATLLVITALLRSAANPFGLFDLHFCGKAAIEQRRGIRHR
jgi:hypothetical protein